MVPKRLLVLVVALLVLVLGAAASATQQVGSGTATITGSGTNWSLTIANTGTEAIKCWRYTFPPGIQATGIKTPGAFDAGRRLASVAADPPGTTAGSTDCVSDFTMPTDYGSTPPPPKPKPKCKCKSLKITDATINRFPFDLAV